MTPSGPITSAGFQHATLNRVELDLDAEQVRVRCRQHGRWVDLVATGIRQLRCERLMPWGSSQSINGVRGPMPAAEPGAQCIEIELQSGDTFTIEATHFALV